ncbi:MAG TPA: VOC family protein [Solirubrobacteraceae bacterium]|jgi:catechol 2,3-dioxygenase|nr:VOC family protein [Solirubrobacteraceae bacterium]
MPIHPDTGVGEIRLTVSDLARSREFYERALGLRATEQDDGALALGVDGEAPLIELTGDAAAPPRPQRTTGLFHLAVLLPTRRELALAIRRLVEARIPLDGASDHLVSEALYLHDPDGNGIEIYRDRPRAEWPHAGGSLEMATLPLDLEDIITELPPASAKDAVAPAGTRMGHVHLQVSNLDEAEAFYSGVLGFDVTVKGYPGALFVSAGGYHHHIGLNTWQSLGAGAPPEGAIGLRSFEVVLPDSDELERVLARVREAGITAEPSNEGAVVRDPSGNAVYLRVLRATAG